jgi:hypothetical protein
LTVVISAAPARTTGEELPFMEKLMKEGRQHVGEGATQMVSVDGHLMMYTEAVSVAPICSVKTS